MHTGPAVFSSESPDLCSQNLDQVASQQLQSPELSAPQRGQFVPGASLTCSVLLLSLSSQYREMDTEQMLFQRSLEVSLEVFLLTRWNSLQFSKAVLEMWKDKLCWESTSNFPKIFWSHLQHPYGVMVWEAVVTLLPPATLFSFLEKFYILKCCVSIISTFHLLYPPAIYQILLCILPVSGLSWFLHDAYLEQHSSDPRNPGRYNRN